jgi:hypothetical protein
MQDGALEKAGVRLPMLASDLLNGVAAPVRRGSVHPHGSLGYEPKHSAIWHGQLELGFGPKNEKNFANVLKMKRGCLSWRIEEWNFQTALGSGFDLALQARNSPLVCFDAQLAVRGSCRPPSGHASRCSGFDARR